MSVVSNRSKSCAVLNSCPAGLRHSSDLSQQSKKITVCRLEAPLTGFQDIRGDKLQLK